MTGLGNRSVRKQCNFWLSSVAFYGLACMVGTVVSCSFYPLRDNLSGFLRVVDGKVGRWQGFSVPMHAGELDFKQDERNKIYESFEASRYKYGAGHLFIGWTSIPTYVKPVVALLP